MIVEFFFVAPCPAKVCGPFEVERVIRCVEADGRPTEGLFHVDEVFRETPLPLVYIPQ
jgi:hypothetical protein